jgi:predicted PurR-regulated permease PerM
MDPGRVPPLLEFTAEYSRRILLTAAAAVVVGYVLVRLSAVVLPVIIALLVTALLSPAVGLLRRARVPDGLAAAGVLVLALAGVVATFAWVGPAAAAQFDELQAGVRRGVARLSVLLAESPLELSPLEVQDRLADAAEQVRRNLGGLAGRVLTGAAFVLNLVAAAILTLFVAFFFLKDGPRIARWLTGLVRPEWQDEALELGQRAFAVLVVYARGVLFVAVVDAVFIGLALLLIGVPLVLPLAVVTFFGAFFPLVGAIVAGTLAVLVALVTNGVGSAVLVLVAVLAVQQLEGNVLYPLIVGSSLRLHPLAILLALTAGSVVAGIVGALLAVPVAAVARVAGSYVRERAEASGASLQADPEPERAGET